MTPYDDDFPTCRKTFAALRTFLDSVGPEVITAKLGITPTANFLKGDRHGGGKFSRKFNGWFLSSEGLVESKDTRRHIDWVISQLANHEVTLKEMRAAGFEMDISCFWLSTGQGGPIISPAQMRELSQLELEIWWDVYFDGDEDKPQADPKNAM
jgi:hypothetical protein